MAHLQKVGPIVPQHAHDSGIGAAPDLHSRTPQQLRNSQPGCNGMGKRGRPDLLDERAPTA